MKKEVPHDIKEVAGHFAIEGTLFDYIPYGNGHINDTYLSRFAVDGRQHRYIHQRINHHVFKKPVEVMANIERVLSHLRTEVRIAGGDVTREVLTLIRAVNGSSYWCSPTGDYWRTYLFIEGARSHDTADDLLQAGNVAAAFAIFQRQLSTLPAPRLHETIPDFHHTKKRYERFLSAVQSDIANRAAEVAAEIAFITAREHETGRIVALLKDEVIPERICHNDTKFNNVLIDNDTEAGLCVIDLDTVMPGTILYDFGDLVRMGAATAAEDEPDSSKAGINLSMFEALVKGYLSVGKTFLTQEEIELLCFGARLITLEQGIRFLTDYLEGDRYYKVHRPHHNLSRARTQLGMVADMEAKMEIMDRTVQRALVDEDSSSYRAFSTLSA